MKQRFKLQALFTSQKELWLVAWLLGIATIMAVLGLVMLSGWFITMAGIAGLVAVGSHVFNYLVPAAIIRGFAIVRTFARYGDLMVSHHAIFGLLKELRVQFFAQWAKLPLIARTNGDTSSQKMQHLVQDIDTLDEFPLRVVSPWIVAIVAVVMVGSWLLWYLPHAGWALGCLVLALLVAAWTLKLGITLAKQDSKLRQQRKSMLIDTLPALTQLLIWGRWQDKIADITELDERHHALVMRTHQHKRRASLLIQICIALATVATLGLAGQYIAQHPIAPFAIDTLNDYPQLNPALVLAMVLGILGLMEIISTLVAQPLALGHGIHAKTRLNALIEGMPTNIPKQALANSRPTIQLENVSVKMPKAIFGAEGIHATLDCHKPTLIVGASGAGKSTLLATLAGEILPTGGQILVDGVDYQALDFGFSVGFLGQNIDIFDQTLADNLRLGKPSATDEELWAVLEQVGLATWARAQPQGFATPLGEYGMAVSGGQARRIALARLLLAPKTMLLLDEPFAGLDTHTRQTVWTSLRTMQQAGQIGILAIATHQIWDEMGEVNVLQIG